MELLKSRPKVRFFLPNHAITKFKQQTQNRKNTGKLKLVNVPQKQLIPIEMPTTQHK